ncbi:MAG: aldose 1-epimerase family protein [Anaerolineae bacterium]|nr:aldose 1-epimerase family protein [Anaerolineae bacterium]
MAKLFGRQYTRAELLRRVGHISQVGGVQLQSLEEGPPRGVRVLEFRTGTGFIFKVAIERGMDVGYCEYGGESLAWIPPTKLAGPWYFEQQEDFGWLRTALGGFINTCGMVHIGNPEDVDVSHYGFPARPVERYGVHDRAALTPGQLLSHGERWEGDECVIEAVGEVVQAQAYGENLRLTRRYSCKLGESRFFMHDRIENAGYLRTSHMYLYHMNTGFPFVDEGSRLIAPFSPERPPDVLFGNVDDPIAECSTFIRPTEKWVQQTFQHHMLAEPDGSVPVAIVNPKLGDRQGRGLYVIYNQKQMPNYIEWRMMGEGQYAVGIEPCTSGFDREMVEAEGKMIWLEPGDVREYDIEVGILDGGEEISTFCDRVRKIVG